MTTIAVDEIERETIVAALRLFRYVSELVDLPLEQRKEMASMISELITTSENGEPIVTLKPEEIDDLVDRLRSV